MSFKETVNRIKNLKVQGAENVAIEAVKSLKEVVKESKSKNIAGILAEVHHAKNILFLTRPTEPCMRNALNYVLHDLNYDDPVELAKEVCLKVDEVLERFDKNQMIIAQIGSRKIGNGTVVFTHCHSSTILEILKEAKKQGKKFEVHNTETRPLYQGRVTAKEIAKLGIPVIHFVDAAARFALKKADLMLIGADAITTEGKVINKIGSELYAEIANKYDIPVYACSDSWKFDAETVFGYETEIEKRKGNEIWKNPPKGITVNNFAFEKVSPSLITGIISELGIYKPHIFIQEVKVNNKWMFRKHLF
ncbi:MAG: S-methyl-5-thioribose-1-phosphate isomerase [Nanoarchaeota archaeon]|nr:S-methyl-5-thioribose-1-phosphate isomerase [Nanoarchaeota archaeon]MBU4284566.1 S-methyl-5-thioribose-1-phosphate isomerase [Nanoarchaeota archaeon]MBU4492838.1 S-methyl-5-thioribose-1-phosphate isomerase [Nanoarchaeota archaeon]